VTYICEPVPQPREPRQRQQLRLHRSKDSLDEQKTGCISANEGARPGYPMTLSGDKDGYNLERLN